MSATDVAQIASAAFVAVAAVASWMSVWQSRKVINATAEPELHGQALVVGLMSQGQTGSLAFVIHNAGGGLAKGVGFIFATSDEYVVQYAGTGFLRPGETTHVRTAMTPGGGWEDASRGVVFCRARNETGFGWTLDGDRKRLGRGKRWQLGQEEIWARFYPSDPLAGRKKVAAIVQQSDLFG